MVARRCKSKRSASGIRKRSRTILRNRCKSLHIKVRTPSGTDRSCTVLRKSLKSKARALLKKKSTSDKTKSLCRRVLNK